MTTTGSTANGAPIYRRTQPAWFILIGLSVPVIVTVLIGMVAGIGEQQTIAGAAFTCGMMMLVGSLFASLTVIVDSGQIFVRFGPGLIRKTISINEIESARPVRNSGWWGWGIRIIPGGWMWNVSGLEGVELTMKNGKLFRIGTDDPLALSNVINAELRRSR